MPGFLLGALASFLIGGHVIDAIGVWQSEAEQRAARRRLKGSIARLRSLR
jgi:hypothetical protein